MTTIIPVKIIDIEDDGCHLLIKAKFNGNVTGHLIIDTGASKTVFDTARLTPLVRIIPHKGEKIKSSGIGEGFLENHAGILKKFQIGDFEIRNYNIILLSLNHINQLYAKFSKKQIWGLLGGDFLKKYNAEINYKNKKLILRVCSLK
ncbi:MAG: retropepsin-like domain-containing protein [Bacteroidia bacterium]|nr:retropepsin-like domain-containing protein [Bacteroidia bacterium]